VNTSNPVEVLDVAGNAAVSGNVKAQGAMILSNKFELKYIPANGSDPNTLSFRPGLPNNPINPTDPPMKYKPLCNVFFTPPPNIGGSAASYAFSCQAANLFQDLVQISDQMSNNTTAISLGIMNGSGILAVENLSGYTPIGNEALKLNPGCAMNVNICEGGGYTKMFNGAGVLGDLDVSTRVKIGSGTFPLQSQLEMNLISAVPKAISIQNLSSAATDKRIFEVSQTGKTSIGVNMQTNTSMLTVGQANKADLALSLTDNTSTTNKDFFNVYGNGYTEIKVYSPAGMPVPTYSGVTGPRVLTIRDFSANKDLFVVRANGKVYAREVEINLATNFPDYVFAKEYKLKPIGEVARYIDANQHLPGFEKGEYYEKNGINVNEMMIKQQEKIEEQMLYIIQLEKRLKALENRK
jgi:hypothetical protein